MKPRHLVVMTAIRAELKRGQQARRDLSYLRYGEATWRWWCERNGAEFILLDKPLDDSRQGELPPTIQRWAFVERLMAEYGGSTRIAFVDADTMVAWNAPSIFDAAGDSFAAVRDYYLPWIRPSIAAYEHLFPGHELAPEQYFNAGIVVVGAGQASILRQFVQFCITHDDELRRIRASADVGTDQTPLNLFLSVHRAPVLFLPTEFNRLHCIPNHPELWDFETKPSPPPFPDHLLSDPASYRFLESGYVWHFTNGIKCKPIFMEATWRRIQHLYEPATPPGPESGIRSS